MRAFVTVDALCGDAAVETDEGAGVCRALNPIRPVLRYICGGIDDAVISHRATCRSPRDDGYRRQKRSGSRVPAERCCRLTYAIDDRVEHWYWA
jgi:hypothetical protein